MPLNVSEVLVVRVPLTEGEMLPVPLVKTGGRSELTPASADSRCVKLRVEVGTCTSSWPVNWRKVVAVVGRVSGAVSVMLTSMLTSPTSSFASMVRGTEASTSASAMAFLKPEASNEMLYLPTGSTVSVQRPSASAVTVRTRPVSALVAVTLAPETAAPLWS